MIKRIYGLVFLLIGIIIVFAGCHRRPSLMEMGIDETYRYLKERYDKGKYLEATEGFSFFTLNYSGHALVDSAQFLLGQSHLHLKEYLLAADAFNELTRRFPSSPLVPEAMYEIGYSYWRLSPRHSLDQEYTLKAVDALQAFIDYFPERRDRVQDAQKTIEVCRDKLAHKLYANGIIYKKMKDYHAAIIYFQSVIDQYYDTDWSVKATYYLGQSLAYDDRNKEATEVYRTFLQKYMGHQWSERVKEALAELDANRPVKHE